MNKEIEEAIQRLEEATRIHAIIVCGDDIVANTNTSLVERINAVTSYLEETI